MKNRSYYTTGVVARICEVAPRTVGKWFDSGLLRGFKIPGPDGSNTDRRIPRESLVKFMREYGIPLGKLEGDLSYSVLQVAVPEEISFEVDEIGDVQNLVKDTILKDAPGLVSPKVTQNQVSNLFQAGIIIGGNSPPDLVVIDLGLGIQDVVNTVKACHTLVWKPNFVALGYEDLTCDQVSSLKAHGFSEVFKRPFDSERIVSFAHLQAILVYNKVRVKPKLGACKNAGPSCANGEIERSVR